MICIGKTKCTSEKGLLVKVQDLKSGGRGCARSGVPALFPKLDLFRGIDLLTVTFRAQLSRMFHKACRQIYIGVMS